MITYRSFNVKQDFDPLSVSLARDEHHQTTDPSFFMEDGTLTNVYEDEQSQIMFVKGTPALRLDIQFLDNGDHERNKVAMIEGFPAFVQRAKESGWKELIFNTQSRALRIFCKRQFGFEESQGELRKFI